MDHPLTADQIRQYALDKKIRKKRDQIHLPHNDTPFLRALGVDFSASADQGVKIKAPLFEQATALQEAGSLAWDGEAFSPIIEAAGQLAEAGEQVVYKLPSWMNVMEGILAFDQTIRLSLKDPDLLKALSDRFIAWVADICCQLDRQGVQYLYWFDSFAGIDLLGDRFYRRFYGPHWIRLFEVVLDSIQGQMVLGPEVVAPLRHIYGVEANPSPGLWTSQRSKQGDIKAGRPVQFLIESSDEACN